MHFKENEVVKDSLKKIDDHFSQLQKYDLTQEQVLGFTQNSQQFIANHSFIALIKNDFERLAKTYYDVTTYLQSQQTMADLNAFTKSLNQGYLSFDHESGYLDKKFVNGQMALYKEWLDFAQSHGVQPKQDFDELKKELTDVAIFFKKAGIIVRDLGETFDQMKVNSHNTIHTKALINDFKEFFDENVGAARSFTFSINQNLRQYQDIISAMRKEMDYLKEALLEKSPESMKSMAHKFCDSQSINDSDISSFLKSKNFDDLIETRVQFKGQSRSDSILFKDGSYAYIENGSYLHTISHFDYFGQKNELEDSALNYLLRKKPKVAAFFNRFLDDAESIGDIIPVMDTYQQYSDVITRSGINILQLENKSLEAVDDVMSDVIRQHKINQYVNSILSKKYEHLLSPETRDIFKILYDAGVTKQTLQDYVGKKIAAHKTPEEFLDYMTKVKNHFSGFSHEALSSKLNGNGIVPTYDQDGVVIFHVDNFDLSKKLGSASWCIARSSNYFEDYTGNNARQYFMYDFNKEESSRNSMIGFTLRLDGTVYASHLKNDDSFDFDRDYKDLHLEVLKNDFASFKLNKEYAKIMKEKYNLGDYEEKPKMKGLKI